MVNKVTAQRMRRYLASIGVDTQVELDSEKLYVIGVRMATYHSKVRVIEAFRWTGQPRSVWPEWATPELLAESGSALYAYTTNGPVRVNRGDWCICGEKEIYPCTDAEFHKLYETTPQEIVRDSEELDDGA